MGWPLFAHIFGRPASQPGAHVPLTTTLVNELIYLDREFIANAYQIVTGQSPSTQIQKAQGMKAGAGVAPFSAEVSAGEIRSYPISTIEMLADVLKVVEADPDLDPAKFPFRQKSQTGWVRGEITMIQSLSYTEKSTGERVDSDKKPLVSFGINGNGFKLALITAPDYFTTGIDVLREQFRAPVKELSIPVRAYVRVFSAKTYVDQWVAVPLIMQEC